MLSPSKIASTKISVLLTAVLGLSLASQAVADFTNTSANFSLGYGFVGNWNTTEISSANSPPSGTNTPTTQGSFSFTPTMSGGAFSSSGPTFTNRVLGNGDFGVGSSGNSSTFGVSLTGSYNAVLPVGAENVKLTLNVTSISIYGAQISGRDTAIMRFQETTSGHTTNSQSITLTSVNDVNDPGVSPFANAANWTQLIWDPTDFAVAGTSSTRTFNLGTFTGTQAYGSDGFEILGNVVLTYTPEPSSALLLGFGGLLLWRRRSGME